MTTGTDVTLTKLKSFDPYRPRIIRPDYWTKGVLAMDVRVGATVVLDRYRRSGREAGEPAVDIRGTFVSSPVQSIIPNEQNGSVVLVTQNSHWLLQPNLP